MLYFDESPDFACMDALHRRILCDGKTQGQADGHSDPGNNDYAVHVLAVRARLVSRETRQTEDLRQQDLPIGLLGH